MKRMASGAGALQPDEAHARRDIVLVIHAPFRPDRAAREAAPADRRSPRDVRSHGVRRASTIGRRAHARPRSHARRRRSTNDPGRARNKTGCDRSTRRTAERQGRPPSAPEDCDRRTAGRLRRSRAARAASAPGRFVPPACRARRPDRRARTRAGRGLRHAHEQRHAVVGRPRRFAVAQVPSRAPASASRANPASWSPNTTTTLVSSSPSAARPRMNASSASSKKCIVCR